MRAFPSNIEYQNALENPREVLNDDDLKNGTPELGLWGKPKAITGNFATVFQINCNSHKYALKCFTRYHPELRKRYALISEYLQKENLSYTVDFKFLEKGIKINKEWYPALKMEWIEGDTLGSFVQKNLETPEKLQALANNFLVLAKDLRARSIAHGDLQHGNIMVVGDKIKLVDYDGMFVPGLENQDALEYGHPNYQHPNRGKYFGPFLDTFSVWVIYLSLIALSTDSTLHNILDLDEDCLLFRRKDFEFPDTSDVFCLLEKSSDESVRLLSSKLRSLLNENNITLLPPIDDYLLIESGLYLPPTESFLKQLIDEILPEKNKSKDLTYNSWIKDHIQTQTYIDFTVSFKLERYIIVAYVTFYGMILSATALLSLFVISLGNFQLLMRLITTFVILYIISLLLIISSFICLFRLLPETQQKIRLTKNLLRLRENILELENSKKMEIKKLELVKARKEKEIEIVSTRKEEIKREINSLIDSIKTKLETELEEINTNLKKIQTEMNTEIERELQKYREEYVSNKLKEYKISQTSVPGIGNVLVKRLISYGIQNASDIHQHINIPRIGEKKLQELLKWRNRIEAKISAQIPNSLPISKQEEIEKKYQDQLDLLINKKEYVSQKGRLEIELVTRKYEQEYSSISNNHNSIINQYDREITETEHLVEELDKAIMKNRFLLENNKKELEKYQGINLRQYLRKILLGFIEPKNTSDNSPAYKNNTTS